MTQKMFPMRSALVPIGLGSDGEQSLALARTVAAKITLIGVAPTDRDSSMGTDSQIQRKIRQRLISLRGKNIQYKSNVIISGTPWKDLQNTIARERSDIFITEWKDGKAIWGGSISDILINPICNIAIIHGALPSEPEHTLIAVRGGPYAELALQLGMNLQSKQLDVLHISITGAATDAPFKGLKHILKHIPEITPVSITTDDASRAIFEESLKYDVVVLGTTASKATLGSGIGPVADRLLRESPATTVIVKTSRPMSESALTESTGALAISILVDKWFKENTFRQDKFSDLRELMALKEKQGSTISLALPALNEEETVGKVIHTIKKALVDDVPLLDEIVLIDSNSTDRTRQIATELGVPVYIHQQLLPELEPRIGKGDALWKSLLVTKGDIIAWIDTDIINIHPRFVYRILGPLLSNQKIQFVKGFYRRPLKVGDKIQAGGGGRVTELAARPLLNLFYPELSGVVQPLSGEYAGRREALEKATFFSGYGVEIGLLIDMVEKFGLNAIAQVDLQERIHHNQELEALSKMSFAIIQTVLRKLEPRYERSIIEEVNKSMKLIRYAKGEYSLTVEDVIEHERPPMITIPEYRERFKLPRG